MNKKHLALAITTTLIISGCTSISGGNSEYGCKGVPDKTACYSARDVYEKTHDGSSIVSLKDESKEAAAPNASAPTNEHVVKPQKQNMFEVDPVVKTFVTPQLPDKPVPIRTPAQVMRIWVGSWEDKNGFLIAPGYVYTEIQPRRWVIGSQQATGQSLRSLRPLESGNKNKNGKKE